MDLNSLSREEKMLLVKLLQEDEKEQRRKRSRGIAESDKVYVVECRITCALCGHQTTESRKSSSPKPLHVEFSSCGACDERLVQLGAAALVQKLKDLVKPPAPKVEYKGGWKRRGEEEEEAELVESIVAIFDGFEDL